VYTAIGMYHAYDICQLLYTVYRLVPPDDEQYICSKHVEVNCQIDGK